MELQPIDRSPVCLALPGGLQQFVSLSPDCSRSWCKARLRGAERLRKTGSHLTPTLQPAPEPVVGAPWHRQVPAPVHVPALTQARAAVRER